ncbi:centromere protein Q isoform X2 [Oryzias latipes]|uniref:centromere protein Q isoform X2 n=1 Tax=Oryzias latipes TaxID=8090 RepID=UPI0009DB320A|nr:centromere protein Q isoform X2 [Oryzias latipes]
MRNGNNRNSAKPKQVANMKPVRGSKRSPTLKKKRAEPRKVTPNQDEEQSDGNQNKPAHQQVAKKRKGSVRKKKGVPDSWVLMPSSSISAVENILDLSILATLALRAPDKKESQTHLNTLKTKFLSECAQLKVPKTKQKHTVHLSLRHQEESKKSLMGQKTLSLLKEDLKSVVNALQKVEERTVSLEHACSSLREELEEEEEKAKEILQIADRSVLKLPPVPSVTEEDALESRLRKIIPANSLESTARKLGAVLQKPKANQEAQMLLTQAQKSAELLFNPLHKDG